MSSKQYLPSPYPANKATKKSPLKAPPPYKRNRRGALGPISPSKTATASIL